MQCHDDPDRPDYPDYPDPDYLCWNCRRNPCCLLDLYVMSWKMWNLCGCWWHSNKSGWMVSVFNLFNRAQFLQAFLRPDMKELISTVVTTHTFCGDGGPVLSPPHLFSGSRKRDASYHIGTTYSPHQPCPLSRTGCSVRAVHQELRNLVVETWLIDRAMKKICWR